MAIALATIGFRFTQPWWLLAALVAAPMVYLSWRNLGPLGNVRRIVAIVLRVMVVALLAALLARLEITEKHDRLTVIAILDRSRSVPVAPVNLQAGAVKYLLKAVEAKDAEDRLAQIDVGEMGVIINLPSVLPDVDERNISLLGEQTDLANAVQLAMAIAPPDTGVRIVLLSDGNETVGDLIEAARVAAANNIPIDVKPIRYRYSREVIFRRLVAPSRKRSGQTINLRFVLGSTGPAKGRLSLSVNGRLTDLDPTSPDVSAAVTLKAGTNVHTISLPLGLRGLHRFEARFKADDPADDQLSQNNVATAVTFVSGPGHILVVSPDEKSSAALIEALSKENIDVRHCQVEQFPQRLDPLLDADGVILVNTPNDKFSQAQQKLLCRYVTDLGGGLIMVGGPDAFGAGGWIGSPVAEILPVDLDPPQKKVMPKGALVLIMHACEMPRGNFWGKQTALAAVNALSRRDLVGVLDYSWNQGAANWVYPLSEAGDKKAVNAAIRRMVMGDMPDFAPPMQAAYNALSKSGAAQKHIIIISDGDPGPPSKALLDKMVKAKITCTGVAVFPHMANQVGSLEIIAKLTGGNFYNIKNPNRLPQIFIKEAQVVRRALRIEEPFVPKRKGGMSEITRGLGQTLPSLSGYILTGPKGGLTQVALVSDKGDPILASGAAGLGRVVAFTSSADTRWAAGWVTWGGYQPFWKQAVDWACENKRSQGKDCEIYADVRGRNVILSAEAVNAEGEFIQFDSIRGRVIDPEMNASDLDLTQVGPGQYRANFEVGPSGSYLVNVQYSRSGGEKKTGLVQTVVNVPYAPEFEDMTDNEPLLRQVAIITGGRVLPRDPTKADLYSRAGVSFPQSPWPLTRPLLMIVWLALFLLDVAVRRIAVDLRAAWRRAAALVRRIRRRRSESDKTLDQLKARRRSVRQQLDERGRNVAAARYQASDPARGDAKIPLADAAKTVSRERKPAGGEAEKTEPKETKPAKDVGHLDRLLRAKKQAREKMDRRDKTT